MVIIGLYNFCKQPIFNSILTILFSFTPFTLGSQGTTLGPIHKEPTQFSLCYFRAVLKHNLAWDHMTYIRS